MLKKTTLIFAIFLACTPDFSTAASENAKDVHMRLVVVQNHIRELRQQLSKKQGKLGELQENLATVEININNISQNLKETQRKIQTNNKKLEELKTKDRVLEKEIGIKKNLLMGQLKYAYILGTQSKLKILLSKSNRTDTNRMLAYNEYIANYRNKLLIDTKNKLKELERIKEKINISNNQSRKLLKTLNTRKSNLKLENIKRIKTLHALKIKIRNDKNSMEMQLANESSLIDLLKSLQTVITTLPGPEKELRPFKNLMGKLPWPTQGKVNALFGRNKAGKNLKWDGIFIKTKKYEPVYSIARGRIVFSDWMRGYGLLTIIDHGAGYMTLFGYNFSLYKTIGDWVEPGEIIAQVGDSGGQKNTGLYFEIRKKGEPLNPSKWCSSKNKLNLAKI